MNSDWEDIRDMFVDEIRKVLEKVNIEEWSEEEQWKQYGIKPIHWIALEWEETGSNYVKNELIDEWIKEVQRAEC